MREREKKQKIIAIVGPTSSGKSDLAVTLAKRIGGEIISADSRQVYRGVDLISGKITHAEMRRVPHHILSIADPKKSYSTSLFVRDAKRSIMDIYSRTKVPIVVCGTGFYIDALLRGFSLPDVPPNSPLRKKLSTKTASQLFLILQKLDKRRAKTIERQNPVRIIRAIEIAKALGSVPRLSKRSAYEVLWIGLKPSDKELKTRIRARIHKRLRLGMVAEAKRLHARGLSYRRMQELGLELRHLADLLEKKVTLAEFKVKLERDINRYAKRQMRWFKREKDIHWFSSAPQAERFVRRRLGISEFSGQISQGYYVESHGQAPKLPHGITDHRK